jgi:hypothetical protein
VLLGTPPAIHNNVQRKKLAAWLEGATERQ